MRKTLLWAPLAFRGQSSTNYRKGKKSTMSSLSSFTRAAPESTPDVTERQQCWECRRRRLVCDGTQPVCTKCQAARIVCPGYADKKPLTWLAPGQVMSRTRRKKSPRPATSRTPQRKSSSNNRRTGQVSATVRDTATESDPSRALPTESQAHRAELVRPVELRPEVVDVFEALMYCASVLGFPCCFFIWTLIT